MRRAITLASRCVRTRMRWIVGPVVVGVLLALTAGAFAQKGTGQGTRDAGVRPKRSSKASNKDVGGPVLAYADFDLATLGVVASPDTQTIPKNNSTRVFTSVADGGDASSVDPAWRVRGTLTGPSVTGSVELEAPVGEPLVTPVLSRTGLHRIQGLRVVDTAHGDAPVTDVTPDHCDIDVIENVLVSQVTVTEMTYDQIVNAGIEITDQSYTYFNFTLGLTTISDVVPLSIPVAFPPTGVDLPPVVGQPVLAPGLDPDLAPFIVPVMLEEETGGGGGGGELPELDGGPVRIPGVVVIPGRVALLHQFFEAQVLVANGAPSSASQLRVTSLTAKVKLPDNGTSGDPSDDPLRIPATQVGGQVTTLPIRGLGADGQYGTADDTSSFRPGESGQARFVIEGLKEGLHPISFDLDGTLEGLPAGPIRVAGTVPGSVLVRDATFAATFTHPSVVRAGQTYDLGVTLMNTSTSGRTIQHVALDINALSTSGTALVDPLDVTRTIDGLAPGQSKTVTWRLRSSTTGAVTASYAKVAGPSGDVETGLTLTTGVGDRGVPLSPDTLLLPASVQYLPSGVVEAARALLGQAWSVANAPAGGLPAGVEPISRAEVASRAASLGVAGVRARFGEPIPTTLETCLRDWLGEEEDEPDPGFADALRDTDAGYAFYDAVGAELYGALRTSGDAAALHRSLAETEGPRSPFVSAFVTQPNGQPLFGARLVDPQSRLTGYLADPGGRAGENPLALATALSTTTTNAGSGSTLGQLLVGTRVDRTAWSLELTGWGTGTADVSVLVPSSGRAYRQAVFSGVAVTPGARYRVALEPFDGGPIALEVFQNGAWSPSGVAATVAQIAEAAPRAIGAVQMSSGEAFDSDGGGRVVGVLFSKAMDKARAESAARYAIGGGDVVGTGEQVGRVIQTQTAALNYGGRLVLVALDSPIGPYIRRTIAQSGLVDAHGIPLAASELTIEATVSQEGVPPGAYVTGSVLNGDGTPVANAFVNLRVDQCNNTDIPEPPRTVATIRTGADGKFSFDYVRNGRCSPVVLEAYAPDGKGYKRVDSPVVYDGQRMAFDLVFLAKGTVRGTILRAGNVPAPDAFVQVLPSLDPTGGQTVRADSAGAYVVENVPVGIYTVRAVDAHAAVASGLAAGVLDLPGQVSVTDVHLQNVSGSISGTVKRAGAPAQANVIAREDLPGYGTCVVGYARTDDAGAFSITNLPIGRVALECDSYAPSPITQYVPLTDDAPTVTGVEFEVESFGSVSGTVVDDQGYYVPNARVTVWRAAARADALGRFSFPIVAPGLQTIEAVDTPTSSSGATTVTVGPGQAVGGVTVVVSRTSTVTGRVVGDDGVTGIAGAEVTIDGYKTVSSGGDGRYTIANVAPNRAYTIWARHPNLRLSGGAAIVVGRGENLTRDVTIRSGGTLRVRVFQPNGTPAAADVVARGFVPHKEMDGFFGQPQTSALSLQVVGTGVYEIQGVMAGPCSASASSGFFPVRVTGGGTISPNETTEISLTLADRLSGTLKGKVTLPNGAVAANASVTLSGGALADVTVRTDASGNYTFAQIFSGGSYLLTATDATGAYTKRVGVSLQSGVDTTADVRLLGRGSLRVTVLDGAGNPVPASVALTVDGADYPNEHHYQQLPTASGPVLLASLSEGTYAVSASANGLAGRASAYVGNDATVDVTVMLQGAGSVAGTVRRPDGSAVGLADVTLLVGGRIVGVTTSSDDANGRGAFRFDDVPVGDFAISVFDNRSGRRGRAAGTVTSQGETVTADVTLVRIGTVTGHVTSNGAASKHALVTIDAGEYGFDSVRVQTTTDDLGAYAFYGIPESAFGVFAVATDGQSGSATGSVGGGTGDTPPPAVADVALAPSASLTGTVRDVANHTVAGARVTASVNGRDFVSNTGADGKYLFSWIPLGSVLVRAEAPSGYDRGQTAAVASTAGSSVTADVTLDGTGGVHGRALEANGTTPLANGTVTFTNTEWGYAIAIAAQVRSDGTYEISGAPAGPFSLRLAVPSRVQAGSATGALAANDDLAVDLRLEDAGTVRGRALAPGGTSPAIGADVTIALARGVTFYTHTDTHGDYSLANVPLGGVTVTISDPATAGVGTQTGALATNGQTLDLGSITLDNAPIRVQSTTPANGATNVSPTAPITVVFSEAASPSTVNASTIGLDREGAAVPASVSLSPDGTTATLTPSSTLAENATYRLTVTTGVRDTTDHPLSAPVRITFTTGDVTPPSVASIAPTNGATRVPVASAVAVTFGEPLDAAQDVQPLVGLALAGGAQTPVAGTSVLDPTTRTTVTFTPSAPLDEFASYAVTVAGQRDAAGNVQTTPFVSSFRTQDPTAPTIDPLAIDGTFQITQNPAISATYSDVGSGIDVAAGRISIDGTVVNVSRTATQMSYLGGTLAVGPHTVLVHVADVDGNVTERSATFTIDDRPPAITSFTVNGQPVTDGMAVPTDTLVFQVTYADDAQVYLPGTSLFFGPAGATAPLVTHGNSQTSMGYSTGTLPNGEYTVEARVQDVLGNAGTSGVIRLTVARDAPVILGVTEATGSEHGGTSVQITGYNLGATPAPHVWFGGNEAEYSDYANVYTDENGIDYLSATTPAGKPGPTSVTVKTPNGTGTRENAFTYVADGRTPFVVEPDTVLLWRFDKVDYDDGTNTMNDDGPYAIGSYRFDYTYPSQGNVSPGLFYRSGSGPQSLLPDGGLLSFGDGSFTVEGWMLPNAPPSEQMVAGRRDNETGDVDYGLFLEPDGSLNARLYDTSGLGWLANAAASTTLLDGNWHYVAMTVERGAAPAPRTLRIFVDGVALAEAAAPDGFAAVRSGNGHFQFTSNATMDEWRVSKTAHSADLVAKMFTPSELGLVAIRTLGPGAQRGATDAELTVEGYNLANATAQIVALDGTPLAGTTRVLGASATRLRLGISLDASAPLGDALLRLTDGANVTTIPIVVVEQHPFSAGPNTVLLWHLDEASGTTIASAATPAINGTSGGTLVVDGRFGKARTHPAVEAAADGGTLSFGSSGFALDFWLRSRPGTYYWATPLEPSTLVAKVSTFGVTPEYAVEYLPYGGLRATVYNAAGVAWTVSAPPGTCPTGESQWHLITTVVRRGAAAADDRLELYVDGTVRASAPSPAGFGAVRSSTQRFTTDSLYSNFYADLDEIRVLRGSPTAEQVRGEWLGSSLTSKVVERATDLAVRATPATNSPGAYSAPDIDLETEPLFAPRAARWLSVSRRLYRLAPGR